MKQQQQGGTILGFILGLVVGLGAAFAVAVYVTKVPVPFLNKGAVRGTGQDAAEDEKNKTWDPNAPLYGKNPARIIPAEPTEPAPAASAVTTTPPAAASTDTKAAHAKPEVKTAESKPPTEAKPAPTPAPASASAAASADPLGDLAKSRMQASNTASNSTAEDSFTYFVQTGSFGSQNDAEAQRAKLAMQGLEARISEREQGGRTVFRVRLGPFGKRGDAEQLKGRLDGSGVDSALVRVNR